MHAQLLLLAMITNICIRLGSNARVNKETRCVQDLCLAKVVTFEIIICGEVQNSTMRFLLGLSIYNFRANRFGLVIFMRRMVILRKMAPPWRMRVSR